MKLRSLAGANVYVDYELRYLRFGLKRGALRSNTRKEGLTPPFLQRLPDLAP
jgi:hypothetical protein